jgi:hypothetical protein
MTGVRDINTSEQWAQYVAVARALLPSPNTPTVAMAVRRAKKRDTTMVISTADRTR